MTAGGTIPRDVGGVAFASGGGFVVHRADQLTDELYEVFKTSLP